MTVRGRIVTAALAVLLLPAVLRAQGVVYRVSVGTPPAEHAFLVRAEFPVPPGRDTLLLSLPAWSPGSYEIQDYARYVHGFGASTPDGQPLFWDKLDKDTWRIATHGATRVAVQFLTDPDSLALELSRAGADFAFFNGTNLFLYPVGGGLDFASDVYFDVPAGWRIATGLAAHGESGHYRAASYHDLVDSPTFLGRFALDSVAVDGRPIRFAIWPDTDLTPALWDTVADVAAPHRRRAEPHHGRSAVRRTTRSWSWRRRPRWSGPGGWSTGTRSSTPSPSASSRRTGAAACSGNSPGRSCPTSSFTSGT